MGGRNDMKAPIGKLGSYSLHRNGPRRRRRRDSRFLDAEFWPNEPKQPPRIPSNPRERKLSARSGRTNPSGASSVRRFWQTNRAVRNMRAILAKRTQRVRTVRLILAERTQGGANSARDLGQTNPSAYGVVGSWPTNPGNRRDITFWLNEPKGVPNSCAILAKRTRGIAPGEVVFILLSYTLGFVRPDRALSLRSLGFDGIRGGCLGSFGQNSAYKNRLSRRRRRRGPFRCRLYEPSLPIGVFISFLPPISPSQTQPSEEQIGSSL